MRHSCISIPSQLRNMALHNPLISPDLYNRKFIIVNKFACLMGEIVLCIRTYTKTYTTNADFITNCFHLSALYIKIFLRRIWPCARIVLATNKYSWIIRTHYPTYLFLNERRSNIIAWGDSEQFKREKWKREILWEGRMREKTWSQRGRLKLVKKNKVGGKDRMRDKCI